MASLSFSSRRSSCLVLFLIVLSLSSGALGRRSLREEAEDGIDHHGRCPCQQYYEVRRGETLQTMSVKCRAPFILDDNPQIKDEDDVYPGLVLFMQCEDGLAF